MIVSGLEGAGRGAYEGYKEGGVGGALNGAANGAFSGIESGATESVLPGGWDTAFGFLTEFIDDMGPNDMGGNPNNDTFDMGNSGDNQGKNFVPSYDDPNDEGHCGDTNSDSDTGDGSGGSDGGYYPSGGEGKCCCDCCISLIPQSGGSSPSSASSSHSHGRTRRMRPRDLQHIMRTQERVHIRMDE